MTNDPYLNELNKRRGKGHAAVWGSRQDAADHFRRHEGDQTKSTITPRERGGGTDGGW